jgi:hypothetical protein
LLMPVPGSGVVSHLWIIVTQPCQITHQCVLVNVTTLREAQDQTVTLGPGDHPFVRHPSAIRYSDAKFADVRTLRHNLAAGSALAHQPCTKAILKLVQDGILGSPDTPKKIERYCRDFWDQNGR